MLQLSRNGLRLQSLTSLDESQGSSNVKVNIQNDGTYTNYSTQLHYGYYVHGFSYTKGIARYENGVFILPREAFEQYGLLNLSVLLVSSDEELMTNQVQFIVQAAPRGDMIIDDIPSAQQQVLQLVQTTLDQYAHTINLNKNEIAVLKSRMDSFTSLQQGSTTGDAELIDGRVGYDGKTYENIGGAIRGQVSQLSDELEYSSILIKEKIEVSNEDIIFIDGKYVDYRYGNISDGTLENFKAADYIEIPASETRYLNVFTDLIDLAGLCFYDESKIFITGYNNETLAKTATGTSGLYMYTLKIPENAKFVRYSVYKQEIFDFSYLTFYLIKSMVHENEKRINILENKKTKDLYKELTLTSEDIAFENNFYISFTNGNKIAISQQISATDYIDCEGYLNLKIENYNDFTTTDQRGLAFYDSNKIFISGYQYQDGESIEIDIPKNAVYLRVTVSTNLTDSFVCTLFSTITYEEIKDTIKKCGDNSIAIDDINKKFNEANYMLALCRPICIGDSLTSGACYDEKWGQAVSVGASIDENYPRFLSRMLNCEVINSGVSGYSASDWYSKKRNQYDFSNYDSAIIWLGTNYGCATMPTDEEINTFVPEETPNASTSNQSLYLIQIIKDLKEAHSDMFICLLTCFASKSDSMINNEVVKQIAEKYNCLLIDMSDLGIKDRPDLHIGISNPHFGKSGNIFIASRILYNVSSYINENPLLGEFGYTERKN